MKLGRTSRSDEHTAVVVGADINALGVIRSLAEGEVPICVLGPSHGLAMHSRFGIKWPVDESREGAILDALLAAGSRFGSKSILFLTEEKAVLVASEHRDALEPYFRIRMPVAARLHELMDKRGFQLLAEKAGARIPRALGIASDADIEGAQALRYPCVLKPAWKNYQYGARFSKAYVVANPSEVAKLYQTIRPVMPEMFVQEWIDGDDSDIFFCLVYLGAGGTPVSTFVGRKLRSWPPRVGGTASCISAPECAAELTEATLAFFRSVGFEGMGSMEYKRDRRDGRFYMIEPTVGRTDFQSEVATVNGTNIPLAAYRYESDGSLLPARRVEPMRLWRDRQVDRWALQVGRGSLPEQGMTFRMVDACFRPDDPGPWLYAKGEQARSLLRRGFARIGTSLSVLRRNG